jgi:hypothetical protein
LIVPFAFLINNEPDTILSLLESINDNGRSGLDILIQTWCENAETFQGFWPSRVSTLALSKLFASGRPSLQNLTVKGDLIVRQETRNSEYRYYLARIVVILSDEAIMTRSKTKNSERAHSAFLKVIHGTDPYNFLAPHEFTSISFPVKALKIIVHDIQSGGDAATISAAQPKAYAVESDDEVRLSWLGVCTSF